MPKVELTQEEARELQDILSSYLWDMKMEISHIQHKDFRRGLERSETSLKSLLDRLQVAQAG